MGRKENDIDNLDLNLDTDFNLDLDLDENKDLVFPEGNEYFKNEYLRNKIRNQLTPKILEIFPQFLEQFGESLSYLSSVNDFYQNEIEKTFQEILMEENKEGFTLNKEILFRKPKVLIIEIIRKLGFTGIEIEKIINAENGKFFRSSIYEISIKRKEIVCTKRKK
jgi:tRNA(Ile)-lysidine synthase